MYVEALILYIGGSNAGPLREFDLFRVRGLPVHMLEVISHSKMFDFYSPLVCYKWLLIPLSNIPQKRHGLWYLSIYSG